MDLNADLHIEKKNYFQKFKFKLQKKVPKIFSEFGFCPYGSCWSFRHDERKIEEFHFPFYFFNTFNNDYNPLEHRLSCFENLTCDNKIKENANCEINSSSTSNVSNEEEKIWIIIKRKLLLLI